MKQPRGFTLLELMVVMAIIAILASIAVPAYTQYIMRGKISEATTNLSNLRVQMEQYYQDNRMYNNSATEGQCGVAMPSGAAANINYFTYTCVSSNPSGAGDQNYTITATGGVAGGDQGMAGFIYTVDQNNNKATTIQLPANTGQWGTGNASCWITKQNAC